MDSIYKSSRDLSPGSWQVPPAVSLVGRVLGSWLGYNRKADPDL